MLHLVNFTLLGVFGAFLGVQTANFGRKSQKLFFSLYLTYFGPDKQVALWFQGYDLLPPTPNGEKKILPA